MHRHVAVRAVQKLVAALRMAVQAGAAIARTHREDGRLRRADGAGGALAQIALLRPVVPVQAGGALHTQRLVVVADVVPDTK